MVLEASGTNLRLRPWAPSPCTRNIRVGDGSAWDSIRPSVRIIETAPEGISSMVTVTAATRSGRRSRLALHPRRGGGWTFSGTIGVPAGAATADGSGARPAGRACGRMEHGVGSDGYRLSVRFLLSWARLRRCHQGLAEVASPPPRLRWRVKINRRSLNLGAGLFASVGRWARAGSRASHRSCAAGHRGQRRRVSGRWQWPVLRRPGHAPGVRQLSRQIPGTPAGRNFPQLLLRPMGPVHCIG